jgi:membrane protease YdiL (CAAX protease family)
MRPDILVRLLPFATAFVVAYVLTRRAGWLGVGPGNLAVQLLFALIAVPVMFAAAVAVQLWLTRRRGALLVPAGADDAFFQAAFYAVNGPVEEAFFRGLMQGGLAVLWGSPIGFVVATTGSVAGHGATPLPPRWLASRSASPTGCCRGHRHCSASRWRISQRHADFWARDLTFCAS